MSNVVFPPGVTTWKKGIILSQIMITESCFSRDELHFGPVRRNQFAIQKHTMSQVWLTYDPSLIHMISSDDFKEPLAVIIGILDQHSDVFHEPAVKFRNIWAAHSIIGLLQRLRLEKTWKYFPLVASNSLRFFFLKSTSYNESPQPILTHCDCMHTLESKKSENVLSTFFETTEVPSNRLVSSQLFSITLDQVLEFTSLPILIEFRNFSQ